LVASLPRAAPAVPTESSLGSIDWPLERRTVKKRRQAAALQRSIACGSASVDAELEGHEGLHRLHRLDDSAQRGLERARIQAAGINCAPRQRRKIFRAALG